MMQTVVVGASQNLFGQRLKKEKKWWVRVTHMVPAAVRHAFGRRVSAGVATCPKKLWLAAAGGAARRGG